MDMNESSIQSSSEFFFWLSPNPEKTPLSVLKILPTPASYGVQIHQVDS